MRWTFQLELALLAGLLGGPLANASEEPSVSDLERPTPELSSIDKETYQRIAREEQERFRKRVIIPAEALEEETQLPRSRGPGGNPAKVVAGFHPDPASARKVHENICIAAAALLAGLLVLRKLAPELAALVNNRLDPWAPSASAARRSALLARAEEASFAEFLAAFRAGQPAVARAASVPAIPAAFEAPDRTAQAGSRIETPAADDFFAGAPARLAALQKLLEEIQWRAGATTAQRKLLDEFLRQVGRFKNVAVRPESLPAWQLACALEGLVKQLTSKASYVTASTLRTVGICLEVLEELCVEGLPTDFVTNPPIRLLAVDDDRISRHALSWSLSKALSQPDLAENGAAALAFVTRQAYDAIFLDVQMPGMDGFELCSRIHEAPYNRITPVVFVTCQSDFNARAESTRCGGYDLIGKPFLTFEITVMAFTLAVRRRLRDRARTTESPEVPVAGILRLPSPDLMPQAQIRLTDLALSNQGPALPDRLRIPPAEKPSPSIRAVAGGLPSDPILLPTGSRPAPEPVAVSTEPTVARPADEATIELTKAFFAHAPAHVKSFQNVVQLICQTEDAETRQEMLRDLYLFIHSLTLNAGLAELRSVFQMSAALEGLLHKLHQSPDGATTSMLRTIATALDLISDLCREEVKSDLGTTPPIRLLVVDDDPVARRVLGSALQITFGKPDLAVNGESALGLATRQSYDVIFLDVRMPDVDGFALCPKIHETVANRQSPVVFVTSHDDVQSANQAGACGGSDFVTKPFLRAEITVKALVYALRRRLELSLARPRTEPTGAPETVPGPANETGPKT